MIGRGGGDRNDKHLNKVCALNTLQPPALANWNKRNKMTDLLVTNHRCKSIQCFESASDNAATFSLIRLLAGLRGPSLNEFAWNSTPTLIVLDPRKSIINTLGEEIFPYPFPGSFRIADHPGVIVTRPEGPRAFRFPN